MDWTIKVLGVAAALVFGIWAPISYQAAENSNADTDAKFSSLSHQLTAWQSSASSLQSSAARDVAVMSRKMDALATLSVYDFCEGRSSIQACVAVTRALDVNAAVSEVVGRGSQNSGPPSSSSSSSSSSARPTASAPSGGSAGGGSGRLKTSAVLGIVFGVVTFLGLPVGLLAWFKVRRRRVRSAGGEVDDRVN